MVTTSDNDADTNHDHRDLSIADSRVDLTGSIHVRNSTSLDDCNRSHRIAGTIPLMHTEAEAARADSVEDKTAYFTEKNSFKDKGCHNTEGPINSINDDNNTGKNINANSYQPEIKNSEAVHGDNSKRTSRTMKLERGRVNNDEGGGSDEETRDVDLGLGGENNDIGNSDVERSNAELELVGENNEADADKTKGLPIDRGWAWVVLAGAMFYLTFFGGIRKNFGIFFVAFQSRFASSASLTSVLNTMQNLVMSTSSLLIMTVGMQFLSSRKSIMMGSFFLTTANIITAFARDIRLLFVSVGFLEGLGTALVHPSVTASLAEYFHKRRGFANGLAFSGASFGGLIFAPIMSALFEYYGYTGTLMIVAGMTLNIMITGMLLRSIKSFERKTKCKRGKQNDSSHQSNINSHSEILTKSTPENEKLLETDKNEPVLVQLKEEGTKLTNSAQETENILERLVIENETGALGVLPNKVVLQLKANGNPTLKVFRSDSYDVAKHSLADQLTSSPLLPRVRAWSVGKSSDNHGRTRTATECSKNELSPLQNLVESLSRSRIALFSSANGLCSSVIDIQEISCKKDDSVIETRKSNLCRRLKASFDISLFKNHVFPIFLCMAAMFAPTCGLLPVFLAPLAKDVGLTVEQTGLLLSICGGVGMFSRIMCAIIADKQFIKLTTLLAVVSTVAGIAAHCVRFFNTFETLVFMAVILGMCCEIYQSMYPVILVEYLTLPKLKSCIGFTVLCHGLAVAGTFPVIGLLRDMTGNYYASYHVLGAMSMVGALLALLIPYVHRKQKARTELEVKL